MNENAMDIIEADLDRTDHQEATAQAAELLRDGSDGQRQAVVEGGHART